MEEEHKLEEFTDNISKDHHEMDNLEIPDEDTVPIFAP